MKYVVSVSKMFKHRGISNHRSGTKKYWHIIGYEYNEETGDWKMFCKQVNWLEAVYYKFNKYRQFGLTCPNCGHVGTHLVRRKEHLKREKCSGCSESFKDLYDGYYTIVGS